MDSLAGEDHVRFEWIPADATSREFAIDVAAKMGDRAIDVFIYSAGVWEQKEFPAVSDDEIASIVTTNLTACIQLLRLLLGNILASKAKSAILVASTCALDNEGSQKVAYTASKFGLRGAAHAFREVVRTQGGRVTVISPGSIASDVPLASGQQEAIDAHNGTRLPVGDIVEMIRTVVQLSSVACVKEIHFPAVTDTDV